MSFTNGQYGDDRYLIYQLEDDDIIETMSFGQITNNAIEGLAPATFTQMDTTRNIMYKVTSRLPLEEFLQRPVKKKDLVKIFTSIVKAIRTAEEYMIEPGMFLLDKNFMFVKTHPFEVSLICLPVVYSDYRNVGLQEFMWDIVVNTTKDRSESREYVPEMMEKLNGSKQLSLEEIEKILEEFANGEAQPAAQAYTAPAQQPAPEPSYATPAQQPYTPAAQPAPQQFKPYTPPAQQPAPQYKPAPQPYAPQPAQQQYKPAQPAYVPPAPQPPKPDLADNFGPGYDPLKEEEKRSGGFWGRRKKEEKPVEKPKKEKKEKPARGVDKEPHHFDFANGKREPIAPPTPPAPAKNPYEVPGAAPKSPYEVPGAAAPRTPYEVPGAAAPKSPYEVPGAAAPRTPYEVPGAAPKSPYEVPGAAAPRTPYEVPGAAAPRTPYEVPGAAPKSPYEVPGAAAPRTPYEVPGVAAKPAYEAPKAPYGAPGGRGGYDIPGMNDGGMGKNPYDIPGGNPPQPAPAERKGFRRFETPKQEKPPVAPPPANLGYGAANNFGGTVVLSDGGDGTMLEDEILSVPSNINAHLVRLNNNEVIPIKGTNFQIGSDYEYVDYFVSNNRTVSGTHAKIVFNNGTYYVKDLNSKNHTYVDDKQIPSMVETPLHNGSRLRMGSERFEFRLY